MNSMPLITVAIPVYNVAKYLNKCIKSVLNQSYSNLQIILVDDGSTDNSLKICKKYEKKDFRVEVIHIENSGVSVARNLAIERAKGEYLCFVDADDFLPNNSILDLYENMQENKVDLCCGAWAKITALSTTLNHYDAKYILVDDKEQLYNYLQVEEVNGPVAKLYKTEIITTNNLLFKEGIKIGEDAIFNYQYIKQCKNICLINKNVYYYNKLNSSSATHNFYVDFAKCSYLCAQAQVDNILDGSKNSLILAQKIYCKRFLSAMQYIAYYQLEIEEKLDRYLTAYKLFQDDFDFEILSNGQDCEFDKILKIIQYCKKEDISAIESELSINSLTKGSILKRLIIKIIERIKTFKIFRR